MSGLIALKDNQLTNERRREIDEGAPLTDIEKSHLANAIADEDHDSWITHNGFGVTLSNGSVYLLFEGLCFLEIFSQALYHLFFLY